MQIIVSDQGPDRKPKVHLRISGEKTRPMRKRIRLLIAGELRVAVKVVAGTTTSRRRDPTTVWGFRVVAIQRSLLPRFALAGLA